jgi:hypothetical protein
VLLDAEVLAGTADDSNDSDDWDKQSWEAPVLRTAASFDKERNNDNHQQQQQRRQQTRNAPIKERQRTTVARTDDIFGTIESEDWDPSHCRCFTGTSLFQTWPLTLSS